ncbi:MAG: rhodanese-like domain-containing protein [Gammaproteobacteria bacterium]
MMGFATVCATDAATRIGDAGDATYVDVRTVAEFAGGRPRGRAVNLPVLFHHPQGGEPYPNEAFALVAQHALAADTPLIVGGTGDARADRAAALLAEAGFSDVGVLGGGIEAWRAAALPVTGDNRPGVSYVSLLTAARRAKGA